jgi:hypothetical protein
MTGAGTAREPLPASATASGPGQSLTRVPLTTHPVLAQHIDAKHYFEARINRRRLETPPFDHGTLDRSALRGTRRDGTGNLEAGRRESSWCPGGLSTDLPGALANRRKPLSTHDHQL